jgi:hypothetical protein
MVHLSLLESSKYVCPALLLDGTLQPWEAFKQIASMSSARAHSNWPTALLFHCVPLQYPSKIHAMSSSYEPHGKLFHHHCPLCSSHPPCNNSAKHEQTSKCPLDVPPASKGIIVVDDPTEKGTGDWLKTNR